MRLDARESGKHKVRKERRCERDLRCSKMKEIRKRKKQRKESALFLRLLWLLCVFGVDGGGDYESGNDNGI